jgi:hypothetical protein
MGSFIRGDEVETIRDESWEAFESVTIRKFDQGAKDRMDREVIEMTGLVGEIPRMVMASARVPVLVAGIQSWTFRDLSESEVLRLYEAQAKALDKDVESLSVEEKCEAVKDVPIVPLTREWMGKLNPSYAGFIVWKIRELNREETTAEERDFLRRLGAGDIGEEEAGRDLAD